MAATRDVGAGGGRVRRASRRVGARLLLATPALIAALIAAPPAFGAPRAEASAVAPATIASQPSCGEIGALGARSAGLVVNGDTFIYLPGADNTERLQLHFECEQMSAVDAPVVLAVTVERAAWAKSSVLSAPVNQSARSLVASMPMVTVCQRWEVSAGLRG